MKHSVWILILLLSVTALGCKKHKTSSSSGGGSTSPPLNPSTPPSPSTGTTPSPTPVPSTTTTPSPSPAPSPSAPSANPQPGASSYEIYNDAGGILGDPQTLLFLGGGLSIQEITGSDAPEGNKFLRATNVIPGSFWGITVDKNNTGRSVDLSAFASGRLRFFIRVDRTLGSTEVLNINLTDATGLTQSVPLGTSLGFDYGKANQWQDIAIPLSSYPSINKSKIRVPFALAVASPMTAPSMVADIDHVRWEK